MGNVGECIGLLSELANMLPGLGGLIEYRKQGLGRESIYQNFYIFI